MNTQQSHADAGIMEDASIFGTEMITIWKDVVLKVSYFEPAHKKPEIFYVGEDRSCDFPIQGEYLQGQSKVPLMIRSPGEGCAVCVMPKPRGDITFGDGQRVELSRLIGSGHAKPSLDIQGWYSISLPSRARLKIDLGDFTFLINSVSIPKKVKAAPFQFDWRNQKFFGVALLLHCLVLFLAFFDPGNFFGVSLDSEDDSFRMVKYDLSPFEMKETQELEDKKDDEGGDGQRHKLEEGSLGKTTARKTDNRYAIKGPPENRNPVMARDLAKKMAEEAGVLSYLSQANVPVSPFGSVNPVGADPENALGNLMGNQIGDSFGFGGLGLRGTGRGGGGNGYGTIGLGNLRTVGHGAGGGTGSGYGRGEGGLGGRRGKVPVVRLDTGATVKGSLSKEVIRRIVHRHLNEVKFCYERELAKRPDLTGRVSVKFIISGLGTVQMAAVTDSTIRSPQVESCISQAVQRWVFPQPDGGGVVIVTYPFQLEASL